jgi:predicted nucleotidyltransferase
MLASGAEIMEGLGAALLGAPEDELIAAYLYGSVARGDSRASSDVDVGLLFRNAPPRTIDGYHRVEQFLQSRTGFPIETVILNSAPPDLVHRVLRDGRLLLDRDPGLRIAFEVRSRAAYLDLLPHLRRYRRAPA